MKKTIVSMMMAGALLIGGSANAQTQTDGTTGASVQKENTQTGDKRPKGEKVNPGKKGMRGDRGPKYNPFEGIQLTDDQQQRLQVLQRGLGPVELDKEEMSKIPENQNLTDEQKKQLKEERKAKKLEAKKNYLNGVKEVLTPEQYVIFLENFYLYAPQDQGKSSMRPGKDMHKLDRSKMERKDRPEKKQ